MLVDQLRFLHDRSPESQKTQFRLIVLKKQKQQKKKKLINKQTKHLYT